jgi:hypothetical protein
MGNYGNCPHKNSGIRRNQDPGSIINTRYIHAHQHWIHSGGFLRPTIYHSPLYLGLRPWDLL